MSRYEMSTNAKMSVISRPPMHSIGQHTYAEHILDGNGIRGDEAARGGSSRDFKIKSIDGLKLTVKSETKKRKRAGEEDEHRRSPPIHREPHHIHTHHHDHIAKMLHKGEFVEHGGHPHDAPPYFDEMKHKHSRVGRKKKKYGDEEFLPYHPDHHGPHPDHHPHHQHLQVSLLPYIRLISHPADNLMLVPSLLISY